MFKKISKNVRRLIILAILVGVLILFISLVNPSKGSLLLILVPVILLWFIIFVIFDGLLEFFWSKKQLRTRRFIVGILTSALLFSLLLSGVGTISWLDVFFTLILALVLSFYIARIW